MAQHLVAVLREHLVQGCAFWCWHRAAVLDGVAHADGARLVRFRAVRVADAAANAVVARRQLQTRLPRSILSLAARPGYFVHSQKPVHGREQRRARSRRMYTILRMPKLILCILKGKTRKTNDSEREKHEKAG